MNITNHYGVTYLRPEPCARLVQDKVPFWTGLYWQAREVVIQTFLLAMVFICFSASFLFMAKAIL